ncbi:MAG: hypothetical protein WC045_00170 [Patescibacteria group bacterium]
MPRILATTLYDPRGFYLPIITRWFPQVRQHFDKVIVVGNVNMFPETKEFLLSHGVELLTLSENNIGHVYRHALHAASVYGDVLYCDLDRALHWVAFYPEEFKDMLESVEKHDWVVLERSKRAFSSHHKQLKQTEPIFNGVLDLITSWGVHDYLSGAFFIKKSLISFLTNDLEGTDQSWWGEYYLSLYKKNTKPEFKAYEGLEWETPDRYQVGIEAAGGFDQWKQNLENSGREWENRVNFLQQFIDGALKIYRK